MCDDKCMAARTGRPSSITGASARTDNDEGNALIGAIVVDGEIPNEAKLARPPRHRP